MVKTKLRTIADMNGFGETSLDIPNNLIVGFSIKNTVM